LAKNDRHTHNPVLSEIAWFRQLTQYNRAMQEQYTEATPVLRRCSTTSGWTIKFPENRLLRLIERPPLSKLAGDRY
jgi:hypothetical protein